MESHSSFSLMHLIQNVDWAQNHRWGFAQNALHRNLQVSCRRLGPLGPVSHEFIIRANSTGVIGDTRWHPLLQRFGQDLERKEEQAKNAVRGSDLGDHNTITLFYTSYTKIHTI